MSTTLKGAVWGDRRNNNSYKLAATISWFPIINKHKPDIFDY